MHTTIVISTADGIESVEYIVLNMAIMRQHNIKSASPYKSRVFLPNLLRAIPEIRGEITDAIPE